jgi:hypothetical protein
MTTLRTGAARARAAAFVVAAVLAPSFANAQTAAQTPAAPAAALPDGKALMAQHNQAIGGADVAAKVQSLHMVGTMALGPMTAEFEMFTAKPNKSLSVIKVQGMEMREGFDGTVGWSINPMLGPQILEGPALGTARESAEFDAIERKAADFKTIETIAKTTLDGKECYKVKTVSLKDQEAFDCYAVDTHLLVGSTATIPEVGETSSFMRNYKAFGGIMFPTQVVMSAQGNQQEMNFTTIEVNSVDPAKFVLPAEIKAIIKK